VLVHGDFSPKNLLIGPAGPVILDAECAWFGDPAFDLAFVLNHLLLKGAWRPQWRERYADAFAALAAAYFAHVEWEARVSCDARTAALLPALMLARIDGKSPVEYLADGAQRDDVRAFARGLLTNPETDVGEIARRWCARAAR
jgi:aminoglycoside phosphotransferase (APT) family kinase protein